MHGSKHRTTDGLYETRKDGGGYSSTKREWNLQSHGFNDDSPNHRKYIRTQSSSSNRNVPSSSSFFQQQRQNGDKDKKTVKDTKKPLRVFGDWSEFKSSTGKTYFYNCKTEISQWEKPKGWPTDETSSSTARSSFTCSSTDRTKKESSTNTNSSPSVRSRYKMDESSENSRYQQKDIPIPNSSIKYEQNGDIHSHSLNHFSHESLKPNESFYTTSNLRQPSPSDDNSRMSFSSTSSKESSAMNISERNGNGHENNGGVLHSSLSEPAISVSTPVSDMSNKPREKESISLNGNEAKPSSTRTATTEQTTEIEPATPTISKTERDQEFHKYYRAGLIQHLTDWPSNQLEKQCLKLFDEYYAYSAKMSTGFIELKALKSNFRVLEIKQNILRRRLLRCQQHVRERENDKLL
ncbi:unnamed protein product [Rotaria magnacalcarata]|uniref:WW domain-containing protein n=2 Tax=Rotaria magnacalcarata TaxID=392030 RepID=A0A815G8C1_9BILA|nr:unnamed protein product [Rotaria magnacalcarata]CAF1365830.1 unnamed protein product [Rotaria magnacalcarata]CAF3947502.1 unnamed protein product [Rotaria magnacalcarata]